MPALADFCLALRVQAVQGYRGYTPMSARGGRRGVISERVITRIDDSPDYVSYEGGSIYIYFIPIIDINNNFSEKALFFSLRLIDSWAYQRAWDRGCTPCTPVPPVPAVCPSRTRVPYIYYIYRETCGGLCYRGRASSGHFFCGEAKKS